ncbi:MAG: hypothetical protein K9N51_10370 [Candidatus Pacebacteria bacterium]|nr:hypothetical protein [Candidatus Paceibacterota bacterium]
MHLRELKNGVRIHQITNEPLRASNLYCERNFCSNDSKRFLYARCLDEQSTPMRWEFVLCEFGTWEKQPIAKGVLAVCVSYGNDYYLQRIRPNGHAEFARLALDTGELQIVWTMAEKERVALHPSVSPDGKLLAYHAPISFDPQRFGVFVVDLESGNEETVFEHRHVCNAHLQFHPTDNRLLMVQFNRGCEFRPDGTRSRLVGDEGATLFLLDAVSGETEPLQIGKPYTPPITGHQAWLGTSHDIIATVAAGDEYAAKPGKGSVVTVARGKPCRQLGTGVRLVHIGSSPLGRYFHADAVDNDYVVIGSPTTGRTIVVHDAPDEPGPGDKNFGQQGHPHAYMSPDCRWVVFNSDRTGRPQTYVAELPNGFLDPLD